MSSLQGKLLDAITEQDLQQLVTQSEQESQTLEYKRESYKRDDEGTREMLRDITAIANAYGGDLLIGVDEDAHGAAFKLIGIEKAEEESQRIISSCLSNIAERIEGLRIQPVSLQNGSFVLVVRIPRSLRAPHMVTFKGLNQFWIRHDRQKSPMSIHEVKDICLKVEGLMEKLERFMAKRRQEILENIGDIPYYVVSVTPLFVNSGAVDIQDRTLRDLLLPRWSARHPCTLVDIQDRTLRDLLGAPTSFSTDGRLSLGPGLVRFMLHGLRIQYESWKPYIDLFRNGHLEFCLEAESLLAQANIRDLQRIPQFSSRFLSAHSFVFISIASRVFTHIGLTDPTIVSISFYNIQGYGLYSGLPLAKHEIWPKDHLEIEPLQFFSLSPVKTTTQECLNRIWQAFSYSKAPDIEF